MGGAGDVRSSGRVQLNLRREVISLRDQTRSNGIGLTAALVGILAIALGARVALSQEQPADKEKAEAVRDAEANPYRMDPSAIATQSAIYAEERAKFIEDRADWLASFNASGQHPRSLERLPADFSTLPPAATTLNAVQMSQLIVSGVATRVEFLDSGSGPVGSTRVYFLIDDVAKGDRKPEEEVIVHFIGGPILSMHPDGTSHAALEYAPHAPLLLPGDRAVLLLQDSRKGGFAPLGWTGTNLIEQGKTKATEGNTLRDAFHGRAATELMAELRTIAEVN